MLKQICKPRQVHQFILIFGILLTVTHMSNYLLNLSQRKKLVYRKFVETGSTSAEYTDDFEPLDYSLVANGKSEVNLIENTVGNQSICELGYECQAFINITRELLLGNTTLEMIKMENPDIKVGGAWEPNGCQSKWRVALIIPIRDREMHLKIFLRNIIPFLKNQKADFQIFAVEQLGEEYFNKAQTMDAGFVEAQKHGKFDCFIFHDVDMIPVNPCNIYRCEENGVRHLGISRDMKRPHKVYGACIGGASAFTKTQFEQINGFTTVMFGWGGEDDDAYYRVKREKLRLFRFRPIVGNYYSLPHPKFGKKNFPRVHRSHEIATHWRFRRYDGLNSLTYKVVNIIEEPVFTRIQIQISGPVKREEIKPFLIEKRKVYHALLCRDNIDPFCQNRTDKDTTTSV